MLFRNLREGAIGHSKIKYTIDFGRYCHGFADCRWSVGCSCGFELVGSVSARSLCYKGVDVKSNEGESMDIRDAVKREIARLQKVLQVLGVDEPYTDLSAVNRRKRRKGHGMSKAARARISAAQKARWAKVKSGKK